MRLSIIFAIGLLFLCVTDGISKKKPTSKKVYQTLCYFAKNTKKGVTFPYMLVFMLNLDTGVGKVLKGFIVGSGALFAEFTDGAVFTDGKSKSKVSQISKIVPNSMYLWDDKKGKIHLMAKSKRTSSAYLVIVANGKSMNNRPTVVLFSYKRFNYVYALVCQNVK
ncbi:hypothetical protein KKH43_05800 [Patescibacteria group bacterium]|nr:hypothetical protein [Patescibacteria group bacterium]